MSRQKAQPLICEARILTSSMMLVGSPLLRMEASTLSRALYLSGATFEGINRSACIGISPYVAITLAEAGAASDREKCGLSGSCCATAPCASSADLPNTHAVYFP